MKLQAPGFAPAELFDYPWWVRIHTRVPARTYYFGPFNSEPEAELTQADYVDDLIRQNARGITVSIEQLSPPNLTLPQLEGAPL